MSQHEKNQRVVAELARHHSRIRYATEIGSEFSLSHDDLETLLAALDEALGAVPKLEVVEKDAKHTSFESDQQMKLRKTATKWYITIDGRERAQGWNMDGGDKIADQIVACFNETSKLRRQNKEMLTLLEDISSPRRGSEEASWEIPPRLVQLAARLVDEVTFEE